jgi:hypothetical protein
VPETPTAFARKDDTEIARNIRNSKYSGVYKQYIFDLHEKLDEASVEIAELRETLQSLEVSALKPMPVGYVHAITVSSSIHLDLCSPGCNVQRKK